MSHPSTVYHQSVVMLVLTAGTEFSEVDLWNAKAEDLPSFSFAFGSTCLSPFG